MAWRCGLSTIDLFSVPDSLVDLRTGSKVAGTFRAPLRNAARLVGDVDALLALAECASQRAWTRPTVDGKALTIEGLRHPLVDEAVFFPASLFSVFLIRRLCPTKTPSTRLYAMSSSCLASGAAPLPRPVLAARDTSADAPREPGPPLHHNQLGDFPCAIAGLGLHPFGRKARRRRRQEPVLARDRCGAASFPLRGSPHRPRRRRDAIDATQVRTWAASRPSRAPRPWRVF